MLLFSSALLQNALPRIFMLLTGFCCFIITIAVLHIVNSMAVPISLTKSYSMYSGATDAMIQWWYGHNAVGFF